MPELFTIDKILLDAYRRKAITAYNRLEVSPRTAEFDRSLRAEIRDPLWMLTRQWQFGEFKGEDAASAVTTEIRRKHALMDRVSFPGEINTTYNDDIPLETFVERERPTRDLSLAIKISRHFIKLMKLNAIFTTSNINTIRAKYPLAFVVNENDTEGQRLYMAVNQTAFDGVALLDDINTSDSTGSAFSAWVTSQGLPVELVEVGDNVKRWIGRMYSIPATNENAWLPSQLEYEFRVASHRNQQNQHVLTATQYSEGHLDWYSFDLDSSKQIALNPEPQTQTARLTDASFIPTPVTFKGMPNPRFWMMEDAKTDFGKLNTSPTGILHLLFAEFGLIYSNDWFLLPYPAESNTLIELTSIIVTDVFGQRVLIRPAGHADDTSWQRWTLFDHTDINNKSTSNLFYLAPVVQRSLEGEPIEQVNFLRDEMANLVWGVETIVPSQAGIGMPGKEMALEPRPFTPIITSTEPTDNQPKIKYVLGTTVPHNWTPFIPVHIEGSDAEIRLQRAKMPATKGPYGVLLKEKAAPYYISEEEIGRSGVLIQRTWQMTRWYNGKTYLWLGRNKQNGKGEGWSNLRFDQVEENIK